MPVSFSRTPKYRHYKPKNLGVVRITQQVNAQPVPGHDRRVEHEAEVVAKLFVFLFAFSSITVHTNLVVGQKCQDIVRLPLKSTIGHGRKSIGRKRSSKV
jgi:hypothetical protein